MEKKQVIDVTGDYNSHGVFLERIDERLDWLIKSNTEAHSEVRELLKVQNGRIKKLEDTQVYSKGFIAAFIIAGAIIGWALNLIVN